MTAFPAIDLKSRCTTRSLEIPDKNGRTVRFTLRLPATTSQEPVPVLIMLAGIKTNEETLERLPEQGENALIAYHYDYDQSTWKSLSYVRRALICRRMGRQVSSQIAALVEWVKSQPWADGERVNLGGGSLGAIIMPMVLRDLQAWNVTVRTVTMAYGGAGRRLLTYLSLRHRSWWLAATGGAVAWLFLRRLEPAIHLPHLSGEFLIISSPDDRLVPRRCSKLLEDLTPEPKTIIHLQGDHVNTKRKEILAEVVATIRHWLADRGALNP